MRIKTVILLIHTSILLPLLYPHYPQYPYLSTPSHTYPQYSHMIPLIHIVIHIYTYPHIYNSFILFFLFLHFSSFPLSLSRCPHTPFPSLSRTLTSTPYPLTLSVPPILSHAPTYPLATLCTAPTQQHLPTYIQGIQCPTTLPLYYIRFRSWTSFSNLF